MINYRKHIDDFFREKLGNYKETPPPEAWGELEERLDGLTPSVPGSPYKLLRHAAIISLLVVMGISAGRKLVGNAESTSAGVADKAGNINSTQRAVPVISSSTGKQVAQAPQPAAIGNDNSIASNSVAGNNENVTNNKPGNSNSNKNEPTAVAAAKNENRKTTGSKTHNKHYLASKMMGRTSPFKQEGKDSWTGEKPQAETVYNAPKSTTESIGNEINNTSAASPDLALSTKSNQEDILPGTNKKESNTDSKKNDGQKGETAAKKSRGFRRFEAGVKAGYETGLNTGSAQKLVVSPYLQYNLSPKVAIMTQPAVKYANLSTRSVGNPENYYNVGDDGKMTDKIINSFPDVKGPTTDTLVVHQFTYKQSHDSMVKSYKYGGSYTEYELPILLKYKCSEKVSVYGGINLVYSNTTTLTENTTTITGLKRQYVSPNDTVALGQPVNAPSVSFNYSGTPIQNYKNPYSSQLNAQLSIGYMVGMSYQYGKRWMADALIQETPLNTGSNRTLTQSNLNFRLSIGYKIVR